MDDVHAVNIRSLMEERTSWTREAVWRDYYLQRQMKCRKSPVCSVVKGSGLVERWDMSPKGHFDYALQRRSCMDAAVRPVWQEPSVNLVTSTKHPVKVASTHPDIIKSANVEYMDQSYPRYSIKCKRVSEPSNDQANSQQVDSAEGVDEWDRVGSSPSCPKELDAHGRFIGCRRKATVTRHGDDGHSCSLSTIFSECSLEDLNLKGCGASEQWGPAPQETETAFAEGSWLCQHSKSFGDLPSILRNQIIA